MNHGGCRHTMAAMVPHPLLRGIETSANISYNKAVSLKLELIIFNGILLYFLPLRRLRPRKTAHKTLTKSAPDALLNHGGRRRPMAALVPPRLRRA